MGTGGGIRINTGLLTLDGTSVTGNTATGSGTPGGIRNVNAEVQLLNGSTVTSNTQPNCLATDGGTFTGGTCGP